MSLQFSPSFLLPLFLAVTMVSCQTAPETTVYPTTQSSSTLLASNRSQVYPTERTTTTERSRIDNGSVVRSVLTSCRNTLLHDAVRNGDAKVVRRLILTGADMYVYDCLESTPMDVAIEKDESKIIMTFIHYNFDVNSRSPSGNTALHTAASKGSEDAVTILLRSGSAVDPANNMGLTPLFLSVLNEKTENFHTLTVFGASVNKTLDCNENYIHSAARSGNPDVVLFFADLNVPADRVNCKGETPLLIAVLGDDPWLINVLLSQGADYYRTFVDRRTYLHIAVVNKKRNALSTLARHGVLLDARDLNGDTPLSLAIKLGDESLRTIILERRPRLTGTVGTGTTYLHMAVENKDLPLLKTLLAFGAPPSMQNSTGLTSMLPAVEKDFVQGLQVLKEFGGDVFQTYNYDRKSLLHLAALSGSLESISWLVEQGVSPNVTDRDLWTPLHYAAYREKTQAAKLLIDLGTCVNCRNNKKETAYGFAKHNNFTNLTKLLADAGGVE